MKKLFLIVLMIGFVCSASAFNSCSCYDDSGGIEMHDVVKQNQDVVIDFSIVKAPEALNTFEVSNTSTIHLNDEGEALVFINQDNRVVPPDIKYNMANRYMNYLQKNYFRFIFWNGNYLSC